VRIREEAEDDGETVDVVQFELQVNFRYQSVGTLIDRQVEGPLGEHESEIQRGIVSAALKEEWEYLTDLDGFAGSDETLFRRLETYLQGRAVLAKRLLFLRTMERAQSAVLSLYLTHDARRPLEELTRALDKVYEIETEHQRSSMTRARLAHLQ
jgi:hypothetical protein